MNRILPVVYACAIALGLPQQSLAGVWTQSEHGYYLKLSGLSFTTTEELDPDGVSLDRPGDGELTDNSLSAYLEYGLSDRLTLVASLPYKNLEDTRFVGGRQNGVAAVESSSGFGDLETRLRWLLQTDPVVLSLAVGGKVPTGYEVLTSTRVPLGTGEFDADARLLAGHSFYPLPLYTTAELGYRKRGGRFSDEILFSAEAGYTIGRLMLKANMSGVRTLGDCGDAGQGGGLIGDQNTFKVSPGAIYSVRPHLQLSLDTISVANGCNAATGRLSSPASPSNDNNCRTTSTCEGVIG